MSEDAELLRHYAQSGSEMAFAELVGRHLPLVYAAALRQGNGDEALAKDVAQTVFIDLARKASSLLGRELLTGWLYTSTRLAASMAVRGDRRRQLREQIAASMQEQTIPPDSQSDQAELRLVLDEAMSELDAGERNAVLIRFFQGKELKEVGSALGISEDAARMRITRALANLQTLLKQRGVTITTAALGTALATEAATAVPAGLAAGISATALASAAAGTVATLSILKSMTLAKLTLSVAGVVVASLLATSLLREHQAQSRLHDENQVLQDQIRQLEQLAEENARLSNQLVEANSGKEKLPDEQFRELLRLRGEVGVLRRQEASQLAEIAADGGIPLSNPVVPATSKGFIVAMRFDHYTGPNGENHQVLLCRQDSVGFQCLRKWISAEEFQSGDLIQRAKNPGYFEEVLSVSNGHFFNAIFPTANILEYHSQVGLKEVSSAPGRGNMLVRNYRNERQLYRMLCGSGLASVTNISRVLGGGRYLVETHTSTNAVMETHSGPLGGLLSFEIRNPNGEVEKSEYTPMPNPSDTTKPFAELRSGRVPAAGGNTWSTYLDAKFYHVDNSFPRLDELHKHTYQVATSNHNFSNWDVLTNGSVYSVSKSGELKPLQRRN